MFKINRLTHPMVAVLALPILCFTETFLFAEDPPKATDKLSEAIPAATAKAGEAAGVGAWTTDYPAALKVSKERKIPMFIQFTGSDWCGWCQWMEGACLSKPEFLEGVKEHCVLMVADFPNKTKLPDALKKQNTDLSAKFKKAGAFPTYVMVDCDGETILWKFGAHPKYCNKPEVGIKCLVNDIRDMCSSAEGPIERAVKGLTPERAAAYRAAAKEYRAIQQETLAWCDKDKTGTDKTTLKQQFQEFENRLKVVSDKMAAIAKP